MVRFGAISGSRPQAPTRARDYQRAAMHPRTPPRCHACGDTIFFSPGASSLRRSRPFTLSQAAVVASSAPPAVQRALDDQTVAAGAVVDVVKAKSALSPLASPNALVWVGSGPLLPSR